MKTALVVVVALGIGLGVGLYAPVLLMAMLAPERTSYEDVLPYWLVTVPGTPIVVVVIAMKLRRAWARRRPRGDVGR